MSTLKVIGEVEGSSEIRCKLCFWCLFNIVKALKMPFDSQGDCEQVTAGGQRKRRNGWKVTHCVKQTKKSTSKAPNSRELNLRLSANMAEGYRFHSQLQPRQFFFCSLLPKPHFPFPLSLPFLFQNINGRVFRQRNTIITVSHFYSRANLLSVILVL